MTRYDCNSFTACIVHEDETPDFSRLGEDDFTIVRTKVRNPAAIAALLEKGFSFHDRYLKMEIPAGRLRETGQDRLSQAVSLPVRISDVFDEEMVMLAVKAYPCDRRYHLDLQYNIRQAEQMIRAQLEMNKAEQGCVVKVLNAEKTALLGFTVLCPRGAGVFENVMGVTAPGIKGKFSALRLYTGMLHYIEEQGGKNARYLGYVSTENVASINLHAGLGAQATKSVEEYIYRRGDL